MGKLVRALSEDGSVLCSAIDTTDIVREIERLHQPTGSNRRTRQNVHGGRYHGRAAQERG